MVSEKPSEVKARSAFSGIFHALKSAPIPRLMSAILVAAEKVKTLSCLVKSVTEYIPVPTFQ
jgi:hypothetical protein